MQQISSIARQRWIPYRVRRSLMKRLNPAMLKDYNFTVPMDGGRLFSGNLVNYIDRLVFFCGAHEKYMLRFLSESISYLSKIRGELNYMDVGANAGNHVLFMSDKVKQIYAFEPFARVRDQLENNLHQNNIANVRVFPFGLGNENATLPFYAGPEENLGAASFNVGHYEGNRLIGESQIRIGDEVASEEKLGRIDILKVDVEGFESFVLMGFGATLIKDRPLCIIEMSPTTRLHVGSEQAFINLFPKDYKFYYFLKGNRDNGRYTLAPYVYSLTPQIQDVIAIPAEFDGIIL